MRYKGKENKHRWLWFLLIIGMAGCSSLASSSPKLGYRPLRVTYLPYSVKGLPPFPPHRILVLLPLDQRKSLKVKEREIPPLVYGDEIAQTQLTGQELPAEGTALLGLGRDPLLQETGDVTPREITARRKKALELAYAKFAAEPRQEVQAKIFYPVIGFRGTSSKGSLFLHKPAAARVAPPDVPRSFFYMDDLKGTVQQALADHLREVGLQAMPVSFSRPHDRPTAEEVLADYALGCSIEEFSLLSLLYGVQTRIGRSFHSITGPTWARVALALTLYSWPSGEQLWQGKIAESLTDPVPGDNMHLYSTTAEAMSVALSRAVGSLLVAQEIQDILFHRQAS